MKLSDIAVDSALIEQGDWVNNIPNLPGVRIKARGTNNKDYRLLEGKLVRELREQRGGGGVPAADGLLPDDQDRLVGTLLLETVVLDVDGFTEDAEGKIKIPYTRALGEKLLLDPDFRLFRDGAAWAGGVIAQRRKAVQETETKNSSAS